MTVTFALLPVTSPTEPPPHYPLPERNVRCGVIRGIVIIRNLQRPSLASNVPDLGVSDFPPKRKALNVSESIRTRPKLDIDSRQTFDNPNQTPAAIPE